MEGLGVGFLERTWHFLEREVHGLTVLPCQSNHLVSSGRRTTYAKACVALGYQPARNGMKDLVEDWVADAP